MINSGEFHATRCREGNESLLIQIPDPFMQKYIPEFQDIQFVMHIRPTNAIQQTKLEQLRKILRDMQIFLDVKPDGMMLRFYALLFELLYHNYQLELSSTERKRQKNLERLRPVISYVQEHHFDCRNCGHCVFSAGVFLPILQTADRYDVPDLSE